MVAMAERRFSVPHSRSASAYPKTQGWAAFTQHHHHTHPPPYAPPTPPAPPDPSQFAPLSDHPAPSPPPPLLKGSSFANALSKQRQVRLRANGGYRLQPLSSCASGDTEQQHQLTPAVSRLKARHPWADDALLCDLLRAMDLDEEMTSAHLFSMSGDSDGSIPYESHEKISATQNSDGRLASDSNWRISSAQKAEEEQDEETASLSENEGCEVIANGSSGQGMWRALSFGLHYVPMEPEFMEEDMYNLKRRSASRMSRASGKHSRGAQSAFQNGDYSRAKLLSEKATKERLEAERLHAEAAEQIFLARNPDAQRHVWELDLHGVHVGEALSVLQDRLSHLETAIPQTNRRQDNSVSRHHKCFPSEVSDTHTQCQQNTLKCMPQMADGIPFQQRLKVITGVGKHSRNGGALLRAVQNFLLQTGYKFEESRPGLVEVQPKFNWSK